MELAWEAAAAAVKAAGKAEMLWTELARASPTAHAAAEAVRKAQREAGGGDLEVRQQGALAARETVLAIAAAWFVLAEQVMVPRSEIHETPIIPHGSRC